METTENQVIGLVLAGGQSTRMGTDKGLMPQEGKVWTTIVKEALNMFEIPTYISINHTQLEEYSTIFPKDTLIIDALAIQGPLGGLLSAHIQFPEADILAIACDQIKINKETLEIIYQKYLANPGFHTVIYRDRENFEPLPGIYTSEYLKKIKLDLDNEMLFKFSLKYIIEKSNCLEIPVSIENLRFLANFNKQEDLS